MQKHIVVSSPNFQHPFAVADGVELYTASIYSQRHPFSILTRNVLYSEPERRESWIEVRVREWKVEVIAEEAAARKKDIEIRKGESLRKGNKRRLPKGDMSYSVGRSRDLGQTLYSATTIQSPLLTSTCASSENHDA